ncbi:MULTISPECIES: hypothetical protein [Shewanella]|jgi:hypothetical protein|uniref:Uncharacterized protein n=1 Tax=Shewanella frigidimarina TaxID=56812 RepID=A0A106BY95_SHEFR|nr:MULTISPECIES: hypothetical protein [Shewanella]KVX00724.1 hypothetical protein AWJ07_20150 [Shewanella frigidimarina]MBB1364242.1 hypothetical protein [Shewanella sp. SR44-4]QHS13072.1 hypothetical protein GUY17_08055 [Shewanella sp. Arc9-LZ]
MSNKQKVHQWLQETSFRELTLSIDFLVTGYIFYLYLSQLFNATPEQLASIEWLSSLLLEIIIYSIVLMVVSYILLALISDDELSQPMDVREKQISLVGYKYSAIILQVGVVFAIFQYNIAAQDFDFMQQRTVPYLPLHILIVAFLTAELAHYGVQLYKGRTGDIYG